MARTYEFLDAAKLLHRNYAAIRDNTLTNDLARVSPDTEAQAGITHDGTLLISGSDGLGDYARYNLRPWRVAARKASVSKLTAGTDISKFHQGFLLHAEQVAQFLGPTKPRFIIGHSLGAASAQILGRALRVPTITFAAPQTYKARRKPDVPGERWVMNVVWKQDFVTEGLKSLRFRTLGSIVELDQKKQNFGIDHFMTQYISLLEDRAQVARTKLPRVWPVFA